MDETAASRPDWRAVRADYESGMKIRDLLCKHEGVWKCTLYKRRDRESWAPRRNKVSDAVLLRRMIRGMLRSLRTALNAPETALTIQDQLAALRTLQTSLDKYIQHSQKEADAARLALEPRRIDDARREEIARRIEALGRQLRLGRGDRPPDG